MKTFIFLVYLAFESPWTWTARNNICLLQLCMHHFISLLWNAEDRPWDIFDSLPSHIHTKSQFEFDLCKKWHLILPLAQWWFWNSMANQIKLCIKVEVWLKKITQCLSWAWMGRIVCLWWKIVGSMLNRVCIYIVTHLVNVIYRVIAEPIRLAQY